MIESRSGVSRGGPCTCFNRRAIARSGMRAAARGQRARQPLKSVSARSIVVAERVIEIDAQAVCVNSRSRSSASATRAAVRSKGPRGRDAPTTSRDRLHGEAPGDALADRVVAHRICEVPPSPTPSLHFGRREALQPVSQRGLATRHAVSSSFAADREAQQRPWRLPHSSPRRPAASRRAASRY